MESLEHEERDIRGYMELECSDETITHLEKIAVHRMFGINHDIWDVHTECGVSLVVSLYEEAWRALEVPSPCLFAAE